MPGYIVNLQMMKRERCELQADGVRVAGECLPLCRTRSCRRWRTPEGAAWWNSCCGPGPGALPERVGAASERRVQASPQERTAGCLLIERGNARATEESQR